jgi:Outer membrane protein beta-barrel domain
MHNLSYAVQGATQNTDGGEVIRRLNYVTMPVLLHYMFDNGFRLQTGPQLGLLASAKLKSENTITNIKNDYTTGDFS